MNLKHISSLILFVFVVSFAAFSQAEEEDVQMFNANNTRGLAKTNAHDFGTINKADFVTAEHRFVITNTGTTDMTLSEISVPAGVGVTLLDKVIAPGKEGILIVTLDSRNLKSTGKMNSKIIVKTDQQGKEKLIFTIAGNIEGSCNKSDK